MVTPNFIESSFENLKKLDSWSSLIFRKNFHILRITNKDSEFCVNCYYLIKVVSFSDVLKTNVLILPLNFE